MKQLLIALLLSGLCMAFTVHPDYLGIKDTGNHNLDTMEVGIALDCDSKALTVTAKANDTGQPIPNANIYLFYTDYEYQLIANGNTGSNGAGTINVVGNMNYLTAMFILRVDNPQFRSREVEFTYKKCFSAPPPPVQNGTPPANQTPQNLSGQNASPPGPGNQTPPGPPIPPQNQSQPPGENGTGQPITPPPQPPAGMPCLPAFLLIPFIVQILAMRRGYEN